MSKLSVSITALPDRTILKERLKILLEGYGIRVVPSAARLQIHFGSMVRANGTVIIDAEDIRLVRFSDAPPDADERRQIIATLLLAYGLVILQNWQWEYGQAYV
jgi:hypothetical protein